MKNSILFSLACLTLVLSGCFNRSTKVWEIDHDNDGIHNSCDIDITAGDDVDYNGEDDLCQPDTDGDGFIDANDYQPLHNGTSNLTSCVQISASWESIDETGCGEELGILLADAFMDAAFQGDPSLVPVGNAYEELWKIGIARGGQQYEEAVIFGLENDCDNYSYTLMLGHGLKADPNWFWEMMNLTLQELGGSRNWTHGDLDGDGILNELDESFDLVIAGDLYAMTVAVDDWRPGFSEQVKNAMAVTLYNMQNRLVERLVEAGANVNLLPYFF